MARGLSKEQQKALAVAEAELAAKGANQGSVFDPIGQGLSFGFADELAGVLGAGVNTVAGVFGGGTGESFGESYRGIRDVAREQQAAFSGRNPGTALAAEIAGGIATGGFGAARTGAFQAAKNAPTLAGRLAPIVGTGASQGAIYGAGASTGESVGDVAADTAKGAALGGATAPIIPALAGGVRAAATRASQSVTDSPAYQKALEVLRDKVGITRLTTGQQTGSRPIKSLETTFSETVFGSPIGTTMDQARKQVQSKLLRMAGFADDDIARGEVTQGAIDAAAERFSSRYNKILGGRVVNLEDDDFLDAVGLVESRHMQMMPFQQKRQITDIVSQFLDIAIDGPMSGQKYQQIRSELNRIAAAQASRPAMQSLYRDLKHALDDAFASQAGISGAKRHLDTMYNRFAKIRDTYQASGAIATSGGDLPLASLLRKASQRGKRADPEFVEIVRAAQTVLGDPTPNSATASRLANLAFLGEGGLSTALGGVDAGVIGFGLPIGSAQALSRGWTGNATVDRLIQSGLLTAPVTAPVGLRALDVIE
jgi:hypothetical protein